MYCPYCEGRGYNKSYQTVAYEIFRQMERELFDKTVKGLLVFINPVVIDYIFQNEKDVIELIEKKNKKFATQFFFSP